MDCFAIEIEIPADKCPKIRGRKQLIREGKAKVFLSNNTSTRRALTGFTRYGVSSGRNVIVLTPYEFKDRKNQITNFLNKRFDSEWKLKLIPIKNT
ncbi:hypothetical protein ACS72_06400 [Acinetobacter sp. VT 511]|jgi:hypothetical protein|nr:hypothetical protein ACS72_06400 [Acinetobacter sp. VT 511]